MLLLSFTQTILGGSSLIERCFCRDERVLVSSELPLGTRAVGWEGWQGRKGPESWTSKEGSATRQGPWLGHKAADVVFRETRPHCARWAQPSWVPAGNSPRRLLRAQNTRSASTVQVAAASWGPAGPRISARALLRAECREGWSLCPWKVELAFPCRPQLGGQASHLIRLTPWSSVSPCARGTGCVWWSSKTLMF